MKVLHIEASQYPVDAIQELKLHTELHCIDVKSQEHFEDILRSEHFDVIFTRLGVMLNEQLMSLQPSLKAIVTSTTGLNHIDLDAANKMHIQVVSLQGESEFLAGVKSTAEHTWMLLLSLIRKMPQAFQHVKEGGWNRNPFLADELDNKTIGIIGFGRLGKIIAQYAKAFSMKIMVHDRNEFDENQFPDIQFVSLDKLLATSDFVVLLISYEPVNINFIDASKLKQMKEGAYFINTSRGEMVNEDDLVEALESNKLSGVALDVLNNDSSWGDHSNGSKSLINYAITHQNLILTPHMGGYGKYSIEKTRRFVTNKFIKKYF
jgi:D-3-phosphoglycerate dehydrogenase